MEKTVRGLVHSWAVSTMVLWDSLEEMGGGRASPFFSSADMMMVSVGSRVTGGGGGEGAAGPRRRGTGEEWSEAACF